LIPGPTATTLGLLNRRLGPLSDAVGMPVQICKSLGAVTLVCCHKADVAVVFTLGSSDNFSIKNLYLTHHHLSIDNKHVGFQRVILHKQKFCVQTL